MDAVEWSTGLYALALAMARCMSQEELARAALLLTQLGTTLGTLAGLQEMDESGKNVAEV